LSLLIAKVCLTYHINLLSVAERKAIVKTLDWWIGGNTVYKPFKGIVMKLSTYARKL
jgi:hypothetical protein